ncbi:hypothetical protein OROMI_031030 [Orobanche minor]
MSGYDIPRHVCLVAPSYLERADWIYPAFTEARGVNFSYEDVLVAYNLKAHKSDYGRYQFLSYLKMPLILGLKDCDKRWKERYFLVPSDVLGMPADHGIPQAWSVAQYLKRRNLVLFGSIQEKIAWFHRFSKEDRDYRNILSLQSENMSNTFLPPLAEKDAMELYRQRRKKKIVASTSGEGFKEVEEVIALSTPPPIGMQKKKKKRDGAFDSTNLSDSITLSFPSSAAAHSKFDPHVREVEKLLFEKTMISSRP